MYTIFQTAWGDFIFQSGFLLCPVWSDVVLSPLCWVAPVVLMGVCAAWETLPSLPALCSVLIAAGWV